MSTEVVKEAKLEEEPRQCTKKEKLGHAIGVLGHDSMLEHHDLARSVQGGV